MLSKFLHYEEIMQDTSSRHLYNSHVASSTSSSGSQLMIIMLAATDGRTPFSLQGSMHS